MKQEKNRESFYILKMVYRTTTLPRLVYNIEKLNAFVYCEVFRSSSISFQPILYFVKILPSLCYYVECTILQQLLVVFIYSSPSPLSFDVIQDVKNIPHL